MKTFLALFLLCGGVAAAKNPVVSGMGYGDPHLHIFGNKAYIYTSHDVDPGAQGYVMTDWYVLSSSDMLDWQVAKALDVADTYIGRSTACWALDVALRNGKYYLYFSEGNLQTGVAVADRPEGPFRDVLRGPLLPEKLTPTREYDPAVFVDDDPARTPYIVFGGPKWAYGDAADDYYIARLNDDMISLGEQPRKIHVNDGVDDKPFLHKHGDAYYLSWASHYATSSDVYGPYTYRGNIGTSPDHGSFAEWNNQWFNAFAIFEPTRFYRATGLAYVHFRANGEMAPVDSLIRAYGVGQYEADWKTIEAEWYMAASDAICKREMTDGGFEVATESERGELYYPNVHGMPRHALLRLKVKSPQGGRISVRDAVTRKRLGTISLAFRNEYAEAECRLKNQPGDRSLVFELDAGISLDGFSVIPSGR